MAENILEIKDLVVEYVTRDETVHAVNNVSLTLKKGATLGLVGETGAGKTTIARTILGILPVPPAEIRQGQIIFDGEDLLAMDEAKMRTVRGRRISMIFQDPMTALNPVMTVGDQIREVIEIHEPDLPKNEQRKRAEEMLELVGIPAERYIEYPHQFSGGMKQRVVIAMALACSPDLLLADEPTTALDVTIQAQVLDLMKDLNRKKATTTILITHDLGVVAGMCDQVAVIYAGEIVETGSLEDVFDRPTHPYTVGLFNAIPKLDGDEEYLSPIQGLPPNPANLPTGCKFHPRCEFCTEACKNTDIPLVEIEPGHFCRCINRNRGNA